MKRTSVVALLLAWTGASAGADEPKTSELVARFWSHPDVAVREAAATALLSRGSAARIALAPETGPGTGPRPPGVGPRPDPHTRAWDDTEHLVESLRVVERLSTRERDSVAFWMDAEALALRETGARLRAALAAGLPGEPAGRPGSREAAAEEVLVRRDRARAFVHEYCRDRAQSWAVGSPEEANNARLKKALADLGPSAAPHLLRVLAVNPYKAFAHAVPGGSAIAQVAAVFGAADMGLPAAVAHLVYQVAISPSSTAATNAAAALEVVADAKIDRTDGMVPREAVLAWWDAHRAEHVESLRWLLLSALADLRADAAREAVGLPDAAAGAMGGVHEPAAALAKALPRIAGPGFPLVWEGDASARLASVRAAEAWVASTLGR